MEKKSTYKFTAVPLRAGRDPGDGISELVELQEWDGYHDAKVGIAYTYKGKVLFDPARDVAMSPETALAVYSLLLEIKAGGLPSGEYFPIAPNRNPKGF